MSSLTDARRKYSLRATPRVSANQLADYLSASPVRRKSIIRDAKFPKQMITALYKDARSTIARYLIDPSSGPDIITEAMVRLDGRENAPDATDWTRSDCRQSREALDAFLRSFNALGIGRYRFIAPGGALPPLVVAGVSVSISLDAIVEARTRGEIQRMGGLLLTLSKSGVDRESLVSMRAREERAATAAVLCLAACEGMSASNSKADPRLCLSLDVFSQKLISAPAGYKTRRKNIELACEEIADRWGRIDPPDDYDGPDSD